MYHSAFLKAVFVAPLATKNNRPLFCFSPKHNTPQIAEVGMILWPPFMSRTAHVIEDSIFVLCGLHSSWWTTIIYKFSTRLQNLGCLVHIDSSCEWLGTAFMGDWAIKINEWGVIIIYKHSTNYYICCWPLASPTISIHSFTHFFLVQNHAFKWCMRLMIFSLLNKYWSWLIKYKDWLMKNVDHVRCLD